MGHSTLRRAGADDAEAVAALLTAAFRDDPSMRPLVRTRRNPEAALRRMLHLQLVHEYLPHGVVDVIETDGALTGAAAWLTPSGLPRHAAARTPAGLLPALGRDMAVVMRAERICAEHQPRFPHWYLYMLGVSPAAHGRGAGSALLAHGIERAGSTPIYLEATTDRSAALYARLGFEDRARFVVPGPATLRGMCRSMTPG